MCLLLPFKSVWYNLFLCENLPLAVHVEWFYWQHISYSSLRKSLSSSLKENFTKYKILDFFFLSLLKYFKQLFLFCLVSDKISTCDSYRCSPIGKAFVPYPSQPFFKMFNVSLVFCTSHRICSGVVYWRYLFLVWICDLENSCRYHLIHFFCTLLFHLQLCYTFEIVPRFVNVMDFFFHFFLFAFFCLRISVILKVCSYRLLLMNWDNVCLVGESVYVKHCWGHFRCIKSATLWVEKPFQFF